MSGSLELDGRRSPTDAVGSVLRWTYISWGGSLVMITGRDGTWLWILVRLAVVGLLLAGLLWTLQRRRWVGPSAITAGLIGVVVGGGIGVPHVLRSDNGLLSSAGMITLLAGLAQLLCGAVLTLHNRGAWGRCAGALGLTIVTALTALTFVPAVVATNVPATELDSETPGTFGLSYESVAFDTPDGVTMSAWYVPSTNNAAVVVRHGSGSTRSDVLRQMVVLAHHGYGVLVADARGHGLSEGRAMDFGWFGNADISAAVTYLAGRRDVDPARIGVLGLSMGGEEAIGAAASDARIRAVVAEGATGRTDGDTGWLSDTYGARGAVQEGIEWLRYTLTDLLTSAPKPINLFDAVTRATSTPFLLIAAGNVPDEQHVADNLDAASDHVTTWVVPSAGHTQGLTVAPTEWERRVIAFLDDSLRRG